MKTKRITLKMKAEAAGRPLAHSDLAIAEMQAAEEQPVATLISRCASPESSNVVEGKYNLDTKTLKVMFKSGAYQYDGWTEEEWADYQATISKGSFMNSKNRGFNGPKHKTTLITAEQYEAD